MGDLSKNTTIEAPLETVFNYVADPHNAPAYSSSIRRIVSGPEGRAGIGQSWRVEANFLGQPRLILLRLSELHPPHAVRFTLEGDPQASLLWRFVEGPRPGQTRAWLTLEVPSVPSMMLNLVMGSLLSSDVERLKAALEK